MSSNFSNYFFKAYDNKPHFDEFVYGFNGTSGSQRMDGSKQAVGTIEFEASVYNRSSGLKNNGFSITGSFDNSSTFQKSLIRIDVDSTYTDGDYFASSSSEVWLRLNSTPFLIQKETLLPYLSNVINLHRVDPISSGPPVLAEVSGSFLILTQINPGSTGNECEIQNYVNSISDTTITSFSGGAAIGGGPYSINWSPSASQKMAKQTRIVNSYVLSPVRHGNFADVL